MAMERFHRASAGRKLRSGQLCFLTGFLSHLRLDHECLKLA